MSRPLTFPLKEYCSCFTVYCHPKKQMTLSYVATPNIPFKGVLLLLYCMSVYRKRKEVSLSLAGCSKPFCKNSSFSETRRFFMGKSSFSISLKGFSFSH